MIIIIFNKILVLLFIISCLNVIKNGFVFLQTWNNQKQDEAVKFKLSERAKLFLVLSIAFIFMSIFTGIKL